MERKRDITAEDLNKAMEQVAEKAFRENRALGLETWYKKGDYLVKIDADGKEHKVKKIEKSKRKYTTSNAVSLN